LARVCQRVEADGIFQVGSNRMKPYGLSVPKIPTCGKESDSPTGPVAQGIEHPPPKRGVAGPNPAGLTTPADQLRQAVQESQVEREWRALQARIEQIEDWVAAYGVTRDVACIAEGRLHAAKKLPLERRLAAIVAVTSYLMANMAPERRVAQEAN
jgi:hypothetical protein